MKESQSLDGELTRAGRILSERFGHDKFLPGQEESLKSILSRRNLLVVMPTGSGKSLLYQLPALMEEGVTIVVSPLISLMKDQVDELRRKGIPATFVNSSLSAEEQQKRLNACADGGIKLLYIAPERFQNAGFISVLGRINVSRLAVDEAHCISEWGHDFRPDYLKLAKFREKMRKPLVTALTATATRRVQQDIIESLGFAMGEVDVHVHGFDRPNLLLDVVGVIDEDEKNEFLIKFLEEEKGTGIIYTGTRKTAEKLRDILHSVEPRTAVYHAGMEPEERTAAQDAFIGGKTRVVAATSAFGMGIDKPDVRFVAHYNYPGSVEQYYQEIGRAGRDGLTSRCVLLHWPADRFLREFFIDLNYPSTELVESVYKTLWKIEANPVLLTYKQIAALCEEKIKDGQVGAAVRLIDEAGMTRALSGEPKISITLSRPGPELLSQARGPMQTRVLEAFSSSADIEKPGRHELSLWQLCHDSGLSEEQARRALATMDRDGVIEYEPAFRGRGIEKLTEEPPPFDEVPINWKRQEFRRRAEEEKLAAMEEYIEHRGCRRDFILRYFGEEGSFQCGVCDNCVRASNVKVKGVGPDVEIKSPEVALPVLACIHRLRFPLGKSRIAQILSGSRDKNLIEWKLDKNPAYGMLSIGQDYIKEVIDDLIRGGYIKREGEPGRPVLALTDLGKRAAVNANIADLRAAGPGVSGAKSTAGRDVRFAALKCVSELNAQVGIMKVASILIGSSAKWVTPIGADRLDVFGSVDDSRENVIQTLKSMIAGGLLSRGGSDRYPLLALTEAGLNELAGRESEYQGPPIKLTQPMNEVAPSAGRRHISEEQRHISEDECDPEVMDHAHYSGPMQGFPATLDTMLDELLTADSESAKQALPKLRIYHPREIAERLVLKFDKATESRERARSVWAMGELGAQYGIAFLIRCAASEEANVRRLAASAMGKVAAVVGVESKNIAIELEEARQALHRLAEDPAPQVRQYAKKSLDQFPPISS